VDVIDVCTQVRHVPGWQWMGWDAEQKARARAALVMDLHGRLGLAGMQVVGDTTEETLFDEGARLVRLVAEVRAERGDG
jgi:hypothetical protein